MHCPSCHHDNRVGRRFCAECGTALAARCAACGATNEPGEKFCGACGASLGHTAAGPRAEAGGAAARIDVTAAVAPHEVPEGERKTVTALFADIKGSMELLEELDAEEARALLDPALTLMMEAVHRYGGYIVQSTGDGIFALFGAPVAHEDHPQRALYAGLRMQEDLKRYSDTLRARGQAPVSVRVGVNTGEVVVRMLQTDETHTEYTPIGHSTSLAARLQALAAPGSIAISDTVRKFVEGYFTLTALGPARIKGVSEPVPVFEVMGLGPLRTRLQRAVGRGLTKFVGRQREIEALKQALEQAKAGHGQLAAVVGEAGVGKSRLFYEFKASAQSGCLVLETFSVSHGKASAYLPVIDLLHGYFRIAPEDDARTRREKVTGRVLALDRTLEDALPYLFRLLGLSEGADLLAQMDAQLRRQRTLEAIKRLVLRESVNQPLLMLVEDLHWIDTETQALLNLLADALGTARVLLLVNYRPEYTHGWGSKTYYTQVRLDPLGRESATEMLAALLGESAELGPLTRRIIEQTEGNPFFMEEIVQSLFETGALVRNGTVRLTRPLDALTLPTTVQGMVGERIDRLPPEQKELLQTLAVLGKEFALSLVRAVTGRGDEDLNRLLGELQLAEFIYEQPAAGDVEYTFKHALTQGVAYHSVLSERRKRLHERAGAAIEALGAGRVQDHLTELARHYSRTDNAAKAVEYLRLAGTQAAERSAYEEAIAQLSRGLERVQELPEGAEREQHELLLQLALGPALMTSKGFTAPEVENAYGRATEICTRGGEGPQLWQALSGLWGFYLVRADLQRARGLAEQLLQSARPSGDARSLFMGHVAVGITLYWQGELSEAREHLQHAFDLGGPLRQRLDSLPYEEVVVLVLNRSYRALALYRLGYSDQAVREGRESVALAQESGHPSALTEALFHDGALHEFLGDVEVARERAEALIALATEQGFYQYVVRGMLIRGCAVADGGQIEAGITELRGALDVMQAAGFELSRPHFTGILAEAYGKAGQPAQGIALIEEAVDCMNRTGQRTLEAGLQRIKGDLLLAVSRDTQAEAEDCFRHAVECARRQSGKSMELSAALSLSRLWQRQGKHDAARTLLAEIYGWFTAGFDTRDLKDAKAVLDQL
jgi:class 3 adenylate cyclase/predicted ATPase